MSNETRPARDKEVSDYDRARHMLPVPTGPRLRSRSQSGRLARSALGLQTAKATMSLPCSV